MKLREYVEIRATPAEIWPWLADPGRWAKWNPKVVEIRRNRSGDLVPGEYFHAVFQRKRGQTATEVEVREAQPAARLELRQYFQQAQRNRHVDLSFELQPRGELTRLVQVLDHAKSGLPLPFALLIWFIHRFGRPTGPRLLHGLRRSVEGQPPKGEPFA